MKAAEFFDLSSPDAAVPLLEAELQKSGVAFFKNGHAKEEFLIAFAERFGVVLRDGSAKDDGISRILCDPVRARELGGRAYSRQPLFPHTDRSGCPVPPRLVITLVVKTHGVGGASTFASGTALFEQFASNEPEKLANLMDGGRFVFRRKEKLTWAPIFEVSASGMARIRFRWDEAIYVSPPALPAVTTLVDAIKDATWECALTSGQGYIVDNALVLHGRLGFYGEREVWRVLVG